VTSPQSLLVLVLVVVLVLDWVACACGERLLTVLAPLQAVGDRTSYKRANPIEDEDDDEYEDDLLHPLSFSIGRSGAIRYNLTYCFKLLLRLN